MTATTVNDTNFYYEDVGVCVCVCVGCDVLGSYSNDDLL